MNMWTREAFHGVADGFWASRVATGLTTAEEAARRIEQQRGLIDQWLPRVEGVEGE